MNRRRLACVLIVSGVALWACTGDDPIVAPPTPPPADGGGIEASPADARPDTATVDAGVDAAPECNPLAPFTDIAPLSGVNTPDGEDGARMSPDELTLYFGRIGGGTKFELYIATRPDRSSAFGNVTPIVGANDPAADDNHPSVGGDSLVFSSSRGSSGVERVWSSPRAADGGFGVPTELTTVGAAGSDTTFPFVLPSGLHLYYVTARPNDPGLAIWRSTRATTTAPFGNATNVAELNMPLGSPPYLDGYPAVTADDQTIYFTSYRPTADAGSTGFNVFMARRPNPAAGFAAPVEVTELNTLAEEWPTWISADGCRILFISDRQGSMASRDIWQAHRGK